jgi:hypothetical protein
MGMRALSALAATMAFGAAAVPAGATWAGDPGLLAYSDGRLHTIDPASGGERTIGTGGDSGMGWSRHGSRVAFANLTGLVTAAPDGSDPRVVVAAGPVPGQLDGGVFRAPAWSPSGRQIVFGLVRETEGGRSYGTVYTVRADGSKLRRLARGTYAVWSPNGRLIVFGEDDGDIAAVRPSGGGYRVLARLGDREGGQPLALDLSPDGRRLVYIQRGVRWLDLMTGRRTLIESGFGGEVNAGDVAWSRRGRRIVYIHTLSDGSSELRTMTPSGTRIRTVLEFPRRPDTAGPTAFALQPG